MPFRSYFTPQTIRLPVICSGGRSAYLGGAFPVIPCPEAEEVTFTPKRCPNFPWQLQPALSAGVARACAELARTGNRLVSVRLEPDLLRYHDVDTTEQGTESRAYRFVLSQLWGGATVIAPPRPEWRTAEVLALARGHRTYGDGDRLPVLADALEEAGCRVPLLLTHLRRCPDHGGRCWVVDLILGEG